MALLMVVGYFDIDGITGNVKRIASGAGLLFRLPAEANPPLLVDPDAVLAEPVTA